MSNTILTYVVAKDPVTAKVKAENAQGILNEYWKAAREAEANGAEVFVVALTVTVASVGKV